MKKNWERGKLSDYIQEFIVPQRDKPKSFDGSIPWCRIEDIDGVFLSKSKSGKCVTEAVIQEMPLRVFPRDTVIVSCSADLGRCAIVSTPLVTNQTFIGLVPKPTISALFLYYLMTSRAEELNAAATGATITYLSQDKFKALDISVPPLAEQQRIVRLLDEAFAGLAISKTNVDRNLQNARTLFENHLQSVFIRRDKGWVQKKLCEVCAITSTLVDPRREEFLDLTHVGAGNIESKTGVFVDLKTAREEGLISGKFLFDESMVLYSKIRPYLMKVARPDFSGLCSADMYPLAPFPKEITRDYLFHLLLSKTFTDYAVLGSARAGMPKVNREHLFEFKLWLPDLKTQNELAGNLDDLHEETQRLADLYERKLVALEALKNSLLHRAFSEEL